MPLDSHNYVRERIYLLQAMLKDRIVQPLDRSDCELAALLGLSDEVGQLMPGLPLHQKERVDAFVIHYIGESGTFEYGQIGLVANPHLQHQIVVVTSNNVADQQIDATRWKSLAAATQLLVEAC